MRDQQIPAVVQDGAHVADDVRPRALAGQQVAGYGVMAVRPEGVPDHARELAGDKHAHGDFPQVARRRAPVSVQPPARMCSESARSNVAPPNSRLSGPFC
jgi:hypothetical protein